MLTDTQRIVTADLYNKRVSSENLSSLNQSVQNQLAQQKANASILQQAQSQQIKENAPSVTQSSAPIEYSSDIRANPRGGYNETKGTYLPVEVIKDPNGNITQVIYRGTYQSYVTSDGRIEQYSVYDKKVENYSNGQLIRVQEYAPFDKKVTDRYEQKAVQLIQDMDYSKGQGMTYDLPREIDTKTYSQKPVSQNTYISNEQPAQTFNTAFEKTIGQKQQSSVVVQTDNYGNPILLKGIETDISRGVVTTRTVKGGEELKETYPLSETKGLMKPGEFNPEFLNNISPNKTGASALYFTGKMPSKEFRFMTSQEYGTELIKELASPENYYLSIGLGKSSPESYDKFIPSYFGKYGWEGEFSKGVENTLKNWVISPLVGIGKLAKSEFYFLGKEFKTPQKAELTLVSAFTSSKSAMNKLYDQELLKDTDVQNAALTTGFLGIGLVAPIVALGIGTYSIGKEAYKNIKSPSVKGITETVLGASLFLGLATLGRGKAKENLEGFQSKPIMEQIGEINIERPITKEVLQIKGTEGINNFLKTNKLQLKLDFESGFQEVNKLNRDLATPLKLAAQPIYNFISEMPKPDFKTTKLQLGLDFESGAMEFKKLNSELLSPLKIAVTEAKYYGEVAKINTEFLVKRGVQGFNLNILEPSLYKAQDIFTQAKTNLGTAKGAFLEFGGELKEGLFNLPRDLGIPKVEFKVIPEIEKPIKFSSNVKILGEKETPVKFILGLKLIGEEEKPIQFNLGKINLEGISNLGETLKTDFNKLKLSAKALSYKLSPFETMTKTATETVSYPIFGFEPTKEVLINKFEIAGENKQGFIADLLQKQKLIVGQKEFNLEIGERKQATKIPTNENILVGIGETKGLFKGELSYQIDSEFNIKVGEKIQYGRTKGIQEITDKAFKGIEAVKLGDKNLITSYLGTITKEGKVTNLISKTGEELSITKDIELLNAKVGESELKVSAEKGININDLARFKKEFFENNKLEKSKLYDETIGSLKSQQILKSIMGKSTTSMAIQKEVLKSITEEVRKSSELFTIPKKEPIKLTKFDVFAGDVVFKGMTVFPKTIKLEDIGNAPDVVISGGFKVGNRGTPKKAYKTLVGVGSDEDLMPNFDIVSLPKLAIASKNNEIGPSAIDLGVITGLKEENIPKFEFLPKSIQAQKQNIDLILEQLTKPKLEQTPKKKKMEERPPFFIPIDTSELSKISKSLKLGYEVFEKKKRLKLGKGKYKDIGFIKISSIPLTEAGAKVLLMEELKKTARRSGFIKPIQAEEIQSYKDYELETLSPQFEAGKKNKNLIVQKAKFSIGTAGEKKEISYRGKKRLKLL